MSSKSLITYRNIHRLLVREWAPHLSHTEYRALHFILDRTLGWNKTWEKITLKQASEGIEKEGVIYASPFAPNSLSGASKALKSLLAMGAIEAQLGPNKTNKYRINEKWEPMKISKKRVARANKEYLEQEDRVPKLGTPGVPNLGTRRSTKERGETCESSDTGGVGALEKQFTLISETRKGKLRSKANEGRPIRADGSGFRPFQKNIVAVWSTLLSDHHPEAPRSLSPVSASILHKYWETWTKARETGEFMDFLEWVFKKWHGLRSIAFHWMGNFPAYPDVRIVTAVYHRMTLEEWYRNQVAFDDLSQLTPDERRKRFMVESWGMDPEEVERRVSKIRGEKDQLAEVERERARLRVEVERFRQEKAAIRGRERTRRNAPLIINDNNSDNEHE